MKQYKVLLAAAFQPWDDGTYYKAGLEKSGHNVFPFDTEGMDYPEREIEKFLKSHTIDFILYTKEELTAEAVLKLKKYTKVVQWYPDIAVPDWLLPRVKAADIFFTMSEGLVEVYRQYNPKVFWLSQAYDPSFFRVDNITDKDKNKFTADVTFVGTLGTKPFYLRKREFLKRVVEEGFQLKWWGPRLPRKIATLPLIFGALGRSYGGEFVWGGNYAKVSRLSKIFLAFDAAPYIRKSMSERIYMAVGCGAFYMCHHVDGIEEVLEPGKEIVTFHSEEEMIDMIRYYLKHDDLRRKIAMAGQRRVLKEHTYEVRFRQMMEIIEGNI